MYDREKEQWCAEYIKVLRKIELEKFDEISAKVFEFMDVHTKLSPEQIAKNMENAKRGGKGDQTRMEILHKVASGNDILFGIWANVLSRNQYGYDIKFGNHMCQLPQKQASTQIVLRTLWTSYDYLTPAKIQNDFVVGGIVDFQMYQFPEQSKQAAKWTMRPILTVEQRLRNIPFPDPSAHVAADIGVEIKFKVPQHIYMSEETTEVKIAIWESETS